MYTSRQTQSLMDVTSKNYCIQAKIHFFDYYQNIQKSYRQKVLLCMHMAIRKPTLPLLALAM